MSTFEIDRRGNLVIEDAKIKGYSNFKGEEKINPVNGRVVNEKGSRNFCVYIDDRKMADDLANAGWAIKSERFHDEGEEPRLYLPVTVRYNKIPPKVVSVVGKKKTDLHEETVGVLDDSMIISADLIIRGREWEPGRVKAYLRTGYFVLEKGRFDDKYDFSDDDLPFDV